MPSKGIHCYSYIAAPGCDVEFSVPGTTVVRNELRNYCKDHLEVDKENIKGTFNFSGRFSFTVKENGREITTQSVEINSLTGSLGSSTMTSMANQTSIITNEIIVCYGFYDAGPGVAGLPSTDQCYVTVTPNYSRWMEQVAPEGSSQASQPFSKLFLPAAHDIGMNDMTSAEAVLTSEALVTVLTMINPVFAKIANALSHQAVMAMAPDIVSGLAITQKDTLETIFQIGARYFEFRPAFLHKAIRDHSIPDTLYFSHSAIPGMPYDQFLRDTVRFLVDYPQEIVVVQLRWDGVPSDCAHPNDDDLAHALNTALDASNGSLVAGSLDDMQHLTIAQLREQRKRLILFANSDSFSTYTDEANATLDGSSILAEFERINPDVSAGKPFCNLQCQATATNVPEAVAYSVLAANATSSCLLATKPICDAKTLPWILANPHRLRDDQLQVLMNDFFCGATADVGIEISRRRLG